jgi:hypothetical protein
VPTLRRPQVNRAQYPRMPGRVIRRSPHREAFIPYAIEDVVSRIGWQGIEKHTDLKEVTHPGRPTRLAETKIYLSIARPRYQGTRTSRRSFWCPDDQHSCQPSSRVMVPRY